MGFNSGFKGLMTWFISVRKSTLATKRKTGSCKPTAYISNGHSIRTKEEKNEHRYLILDLLILAFLGREEFAVCHSRLWRFVSGSYCKIHDSSPVITRLKNSGSLSRQSRRSRHTSLRLAFCSVVRFFGTILAHTFLLSKSYVKI